MSDTVDDIMNSVQESEPVDDVVVEEAPVEEAPVEEAAPVEEIDETIDTEAPVEEEAEEQEEAPVEEDPVEEAPVEEAPVEEAPVEEAPVEEATEESVSTQEVVQNVQEILSSTETNVSGGDLVNIPSLRTLIKILGIWSSNLGYIYRFPKNIQLEILLEEKLVDINLDNIEKVVELLKLWSNLGRSTFQKTNYFLKIDDYVLVKSKNLTEEKKKEILKILIELVINISNNKLDNIEINNILNNI